MLAAYQGKCILVIELEREGQTSGSRSYQQNKMAKLDDGKWMAKMSEFVTLLANFLKIAVRQRVVFDR